jgi:hypothetical protein
MKLFLLALVVVIVAATPSLAQTQVEVTKENGLGVVENVDARNSKMSSLGVVENVAGNATKHIGYAVITTATPSGNVFVPPFTHP